MVAHKPLPVSDEEALAIRSHEKTTHRVPVHWAVRSLSDGAKKRLFGEKDVNRINSLLSKRQEHPCNIPNGPFGQIGDKIYIKEAWRTEELEDGTDGIRYRADNGFSPIPDSSEAGYRWVDAHKNGKHKGKWRPNVHMPKWASRTWVRNNRVWLEWDQGWFWCCEFSRSLVLPLPSRVI